MGIVPTAQQTTIVTAVYNPGETVVIEAMAGTGKTTTLAELAKALQMSRPSWRGLYLCYNKPVQVEARSKFPCNVECRTTHSIAWNDFGSVYQHKLGDSRLKELMAVMPAEVRTHHNKWEVCSAVYDALKDFMYSDSDEINGRCISGHAYQRFRNVWGTGSKDDQKDVLVKLAKHLWMLMTKQGKDFPDDPDLPMPHDGYLKLFQLSKPTLYYDFILFDEAQDANPATLDIVQNQTNALKIYVGDTHQQIYAFRGSKNALGRIRADKQFLLSHSFRFGQEIADVASRCLNRFKPDLPRPVQITGVAGRGSVNSYDGTFEPYKDTRTFITRTNATIIDAAWSCVLEGVPFHIVGGADSTALIAAESAYMLYRSQDKFNMKDKFIKSFGSWGEFIRYAKDSEDNEALRMVGLVLRYGNELPRMIDQIRARCLPRSGPGVTTFTTAHKSKGLEWKQVFLSEDFIPEDSIVNESIVEMSESETNLLYVSITRAEEDLNLPGIIHYSIYGTKAPEPVPNSDLGSLVSHLDKVGDKHAGHELHPDVLNAILEQ